MASSISSYFGSPTPTSQFEAPSEIQQSIDFPSDRTSASLQDVTSPSTYEGLDWTRLRGFEMPPVQRKRHRQPTSFIWRYGWRLYKQDEGLDYWICKLCHIGPNKPSNPSNFSYICTQATSSPIEHLKLRHRLGKHGQIAQERSLRSTPSRGQSSIDGYYVAAAERNASAMAFDAGVFRGLITRMFIEEQLPLSKVEAPAIRDILTYLNPCYKVAIPSHTALRAGIAATYNNALIAVAKELESASTKVSISFDL